MHEVLDPLGRLRLVLGVVDLVELLQQSPRMPQLGVFAERQGETSELFGTQVIGARELEVTGLRITGENAGDALGSSMRCTRRRTSITAEANQRTTWKRSTTCVA